MADDKKQILLEVKADVGKTIQELSQLNAALRQLRQEQKELETSMKEAMQNGVDAQGRSVEQLTVALTANAEAQKATRKEVNELSRSYQNTITAEKTHADTLKALQARLANETTVLRNVKLENGRLSAEYKAQQKVAKELSDQVKEMERAYGNHTRNVGNYESAWNGMLGKLKIGWAALFAAVLKGLKEFSEDFVSMTKRMGDLWKFEVAGWKDVYRAFIVSLQRRDGWRELTDNMREAYAEGKRFAQMLDEVFERENSLSIEEARLATQMEQLKVDMRDRTKSDEERLAAARQLIAIEEELGRTRKDIAEQEREAYESRLEGITKMSDEEREFYIANYNRNKDIIRQAIEYNRQIKERQDLIRSLEGQQALATGGAVGFGMSGRAQRVAGGDVQGEITRTRAELAQLNAEASDAVKAVAEIAAKYALTNDELVSGYVQALVKAERVEADTIQRTMQARTQANSLQAEIDRDNASSAEKAAEARAKAAEQERRAQEKALAEQEKSLRAYYDTVAALMDKVRPSDGVRAAIAEVTQAYADMERQLAEQLAAGNMSFEEAMYYRVALAQREADEIAAIRQAARDKEAREQQAEIDRLTKQRQDRLKADLQIAWDNANEQYRIRRAFIDRELEMADLSAERRAELEQQLTELIRSENQRRMDAATEYAQSVTDTFSGINEIAQNMADTRVQQYEQENESEKAALEKRLKSGIISQRQYDKQVEKLDKDLAKQKGELVRQQAIRDRSLGVFQVAINTAQAIMKVWSEVPVAAAPAMSAVVGGIGTLQTAAILSQPLPVAREGGKVRGRTHEQGGTLIEAEDGERIVAAQPAKAFPELLNLMSWIGKHASVPDTGYALRHGDMASASGGAGADYERLAVAIGDRVAEAVSGIEVWLSLAELRDKQRQQAHIESLARQ